MILQILCHVGVFGGEIEGWRGMNWPSFTLMLGELDDLFNLLSCRSVIYIVCEGAS